MTNDNDRQNLVINTNFAHSLERVLLRLSWQSFFSRVFSNLRFMCVHIHNSAWLC